MKTFGGAEGSCVEAQSVLERECQLQLKKNLLNIQREHKYKALLTFSVPYQWAKDSALHQGGSAGYTEAL